MTRTKGNKMLLQELLSIINESVTFSAAVLEYDPHYDGEIYNSAKFQKEVDAECWVCDGKGKSKHGHEYECDYCNGTGKIKEFVTPFKELNVSNANARLILNMLEIDNDELIGGIKHEELPELKRKLIKLKNINTRKYTRDTVTDKGSVRVSKDEHGLSKISRGPTMIDVGVGQEQITHYIDTLLDLVDFAQKNNAAIVFN